MKSINCLLALCVLVISLTYGCGEDTPAQDEKTAEQSQSRTTNVSILALRPDSLTRHSRLPATVRAWRDATISALESGVVLQISKDIGDPVEKGAILATLNLEVLEAAAIEAEANLKFQAYNFERSKQLFEEGSISEQAFYASEYDLNRAKSAHETLERRLSYGQIRAPFPGYVAQRFIELGQLVGQGGPAFRLVQTDRVKLDAWVPESEIADYAEGGSVELTLDTFPGETFEGAISRIGPASDTNRRVFPLEVHLPNPNNRLRPGLIGKIKVVRRTYRDVVVIPREAVLEREIGPTAFIVENGMAKLRRLELGAAEEDRVVVRKGLQFGDHLIVKGSRDLIDGDLVVVQQTEPIQ